MTHSTDRILPSLRTIIVFVLAITMNAHARPFSAANDAAPQRPSPQPAGGPYDAMGISLLNHQLPWDMDPDSFASNDCWGYVSPSGREYAIVGLERSTAFVEITTPESPQVVALIPDNQSTWSDIKVFQDYAYNVNERTFDGVGNGIQVIYLGQIDTGVVTLVQEYHGAGIQKAHNLAINTDSGYLYAIGANVAGGGLVAYDVGTDPANPVHAGSWDLRYVHDAQVVSYTSGPYAGSEIAFCAAGFDGLDIVDVTDKNSMISIGFSTYPDLAYCHQCWLSEDRQILYVNDEMDEGDHGFTTRTIVFDVSDIHDPQFIGTFTSGELAIDHNLYVHDGLIYEANYKSGLRVFDASDPVAPAQFAYFDTYPGDNGLGYEGAWSTYPFFPSGVILVSNIDTGLFVLRLDADPDPEPEPAGVPTASPWALAAFALIIITATIVLRGRSPSSAPVR